MPIYEYECADCGHRLEKLQKVSADPLTDCPACGKPQLRKLISAAGFRLKGGGWYETDFKSSNKRNVVDAAKDKPAGDKKAAEKKPDSSSGKGTTGKKAVSAAKD